jgi:predicted rRNA methylase YqxC with S4 and FtsJ domains
MNPNNSFIFIWTNIEAIKLLKAELASNYPQLKLAYSHQTFLTYKTVGNNEVNLNLAFAHVYGTCLGKLNAEELSDKKDYILIEEQKVFIIGKPNDNQVVFKLKNGEHWLGRLNITQALKLQSYLMSFDKLKISRAYYKLAQSYKAFDIVLNPDEDILELGSSPGGASQFLLEQGCRVDAVDPAEMDPSIISYSQFKHYKMPLEKLNSSLLKSSYDWIVCDINLPFDIIFHHLLALNLTVSKGMFLTIKIQKLSELKKFKAYLARLKQLGFKKNGLTYLNHHRHETMLYALKKDLVD